jgi:hypothetical protein
MKIPQWAFIDYQEILGSTKFHDTESLISYLFDELPVIWKDVYLSFAKRQTNLLRINHGSFEYLFDDYATLEVSGAVLPDTHHEARVVAVCGRSQQNLSSRDDYRLRGWGGVNESNVGPQWDKGHFIAHSIGGAVDGAEMNVFIQRRDCNRGWSTEGKIFREMEKYCSSRPGIFCFSRPIYLDGIARPSFLEFGLLNEDNKLWVECFNNQ